jgi:ribosomal protein L14E/L6E/L27E
MKETILIDDVEQSNLITPPFTKKYLDEEKEETGSETLTIRLNPDNRSSLEELKYVLNENKDATAIKIALEYCKNELLNKLRADSWNKITSQTRRKYDLKKPKSLENK